MKRILLIYLVAFGSCVLANPSDDTGRFISIQGNGMPNSGFIGAGLEYGQNMLFQKNYLGFLGLSVSFYYYMFNDEPHYTSQNYNEKRGMTYTYFMELDYGWEFMRHNVISFGLDTAHGLGLTHKGEVAFNNGIGIFGKVQKDLIAVNVGFGIKHLNPLGSLAYERLDFYLRIKLQYRL